MKRKKNAKCRYCGKRMRKGKLYFCTRLCAEDFALEQCTDDVFCFQCDEWTRYDYYTYLYGLATQTPMKCGHERPIDD